jgi:hypothetical protein
MHYRNLLTAFIFILLAAGFAHADLNSFLTNVNVSAEADFGGFKAQLGAHFGAAAPAVDLVLRSVERPAEAAVVLWLGEQTGKPVETVVQAYRAQKGQGWGAIAQSLGIKPGSAEFHALKQGNLGWQPENKGGKGNGKEKGKGKK